MDERGELVVRDFELCWARGWIEIRAERARLGGFIVVTAAHTLAPSPTVDDLEALADVVGRRAR